MVARDDSQSRRRIEPPILSLMPNAPRLSVVRDQARPRKLGRYELEECLGSQGGLETYRARVRGLAGFDRIFAVKCMRRRRGDPINLNDPFIKTARRTAGITDPRVARVLDADVIDGVAIAVTEFVHGLDLERFRECAQVAGVLATGSDEAAEKWQKIVAYIGAEVAGGLSAMHALSPPLVHGGLTPRNIFASARGGIKVLDVGLRSTAEKEAQKAGESTPRRAVGYTAPELTAADPSTSSDVRSLGAILFELATGELPPPAAASAAARKILDSLWPSMADFIAGLLADDPALRPGAGEAAKILADHWADIPDASMVAEMTALVRNFSAFVADSTLPKTDSPLPVETRSDAQSMDVQAPPTKHALPEPEDDDLSQELVLPPTAPPSPSASGSFLAPDGPTVARQSGSFASLLFQARPTDPSIPPFAEAPPTLADSSDSPVRHSPTIMAFPVVASPAQDELREPSTKSTDSASAAGSEDAAPIPELEDWGARALAALGGEAGVHVSAFAAPTARASGEFLAGPTAAAPPPVSDPTIEEAFAFTSPAPATKPPPVAPAASHLLEDELVDEQPEPTLVSASAFDVASAEDDEASSPPAQDIVGVVAQVDQVGHQLEAATQSALVASAFAEENLPPPAEQQVPPRPAQGMSVPGAGEVRRPVPRTAVRTQAALAVGAADDELSVVAPSRARRIAVAAAVVLGIGGVVVGVTTSLGGWKSIFGKRGAPPALKQPARRLPKTSLAAIAATQPAPAAVAKEAILPQEKPHSAPVAATPAPAKTTADVPAVAPSPPSLAAKVAGKPGSGAIVSLPIASKPDGAVVWIDGEERGTTPVVLKLKAGHARVVLVHAGYLSAASSVDVNEGEKVDEALKPVEPPMTGEARFRAECKTAGKLPIVVDGRETGILCPYSKMRVEPGVHTIGVLVPATGNIHEKEITLSAGVRSIAFGD
jgi:serine/threonine protein kinase